MSFDQRLHAAAEAGDIPLVRDLLAGAGRAKLAELAMTTGLAQWLAGLVHQEQRWRELSAAVIDPLAAAIACPTVWRLRLLRCDNDPYSSLPLTELYRRVSPMATRQIGAEWPDADAMTLASVYRWVLRGLPAHLACRKVRLSHPAKAGQQRLGAFRPFANDACLLPGPFSRATG
jgi:hypothetical protein